MVTHPEYVFLSATVQPTVAQRASQPCRYKTRHAASLANRKKHMTASLLQMESIHNRDNYGTSCGQSFLNRNEQQISIPFLLASYPPWLDAISNTEYSRAEKGCPVLNAWILIAKIPKFAFHEIFESDSLSACSCAFCFRGVLVRQPAAGRSESHKRLRSSSGDEC